MDFSLFKLAAVGGGLVMALVLALMILRDYRQMVWLLAGMLLATAMATQGEELKYNNTWLRPLQVIRAELYMAAGIGLTMSVLLHFGRITFRGVAGAGLMLLIIQSYAGLLDMVHTGDAKEGLKRLGLVGATIPAAMVAVPSALRAWEDYTKLLRVMACVGIVWAGAVFVQVFLDRSQLTTGTPARLTGMLGNPQGAAVFLAPMATIATWLAFNDWSRRLRWIWIALSATMVVFIAWTGSRTGSLMFLIGLMGILATRLGRAVFLPPLAGGAVVGLAALVGKLGIALPTDRLLSGADTRTLVWRILLEDALSAGLIGEGGIGARAVENSFLLGTIIYGYGMSLLILLLMVATGVQAIRAWRVRGWIPPAQRRLVDLGIAFFAMYAAGSMFEGYIVLRVEANTVYMLLFAGMMGRLVAMAREQVGTDGYSAEPMPIVATYGEA